MTDKQWNALERMCSKGPFSATLSLGDVTLTKIKTRVKSFPIYRLEYPSYDIELYKDSSIDNTDGHYLRYLYNEWLSMSME